MSQTITRLRAQFLKFIMSDWYRAHLQRFECVIPFMVLLGIEALVVAHYFMSYIWIGGFYTRWAVMIVVGILNTIFLTAFLIAWKGDCGTVDYVLAHLREYPTGHLITRELLDSLPHCALCGMPKPPRCHHCRRCGHCHLRLDHHCPTVGQCIAIGNQQAFMMMLLWACVMIAFGGSVQLFGPVVPTVPALSIVVRSILTSIDVALFVGCLVFLIQIMKKLQKNVTTFDYITGRVSNRYDLGKKENIKCIFGGSVWRKLLPQRRGAITGFEYALESYRRPGSEPDTFVTRSYM